MTDSTQSVIRRGHPGAGKKRTGKTPKGRQVDPTALAEVQALLGETPARRDLLIEYLHLLQDRYGYLSARHLAALAQQMRISESEVYEVATFYAHFDVVADGEEPPPPLTVRVCDGIACEMAGAQAMLAELAEQAGSKVRVLRAPCMGRCDKAPVAEVGHHHLMCASSGSVMTAIREGRTEHLIPDYIDYDTYIETGGYRLLRECLSGRRSVDEIISALEHSELRGLGGAGFPTGRKWRIVRGYTGPRLMAVNCDEGEPGTFKDRYYLERDPHRFIEGMLIAAWAVESGRVKEPGVKLAPAGVTIRQLIDEFCGGMQDGQQLKGYLPGGASGGILPASLDDVPLDFGTLEEYGCFIGSAAVVVFGEQDNMKDVALNLMRFFEDESCGQCTPCRVGTEKAVKLMMQDEWDQGLLTELSKTMTDASICGLGQAAGNPINSVLKYFPEDL